jgi:hypothetical protein
MRTVVQNVSEYRLEAVFIMDHLIIWIMDHGSSLPVAVYASTINIEVQLLLPLIRHYLH